jgi:hypothetical protein
MLSTSESRVYPYQRINQIPTECDFCGAKPVQCHKFDVETDPELSARFLFVCSKFECQEKLDASIVAFNKNERRISLVRIQRSLPSIFTKTFSIRRSNGDVDEGWAIPTEWASRQELNTLQCLRGEPWWRIVLQKGESIRHTFLHELQELNPDAEDCATLMSLLPPAKEEPDAEFLEYYAKEVWNIPNPSDKFLAQSRATFP